MIGAGKWLDKAKFIYVSKEFEKCISLEKLEFWIQEKRVEKLKIPRDPTIYKAARFGPSRSVKGLKL